jgi:putative oxidoreductase
MDALRKYQPQILSLLRIVAALLFMEHGTQKLFGFPSADAGGLTTVHLIAGILETFGGLAVLVGFLTRPIAFLLSGEMAIAYWTVHVPHKGFFPILNGGDAAILFCFIFLYLFVAGPGVWSVDAARGKS